MTISGNGFVTSNPENNDISVCGVRAEVISADDSSATIKIPALVTEHTQDTYSLASPAVISGTPIGDSADVAENAFDSTFNTLYVSDADECWVGVDFGADFKADIWSIRYAPNPEWPNPNSYLEEGVFEYSDDASTWTELFALDPSELHSSWNTWRVDDSDIGTVKHRAIRFRHNSTSQCQMAEIEVTGIIESQATGTDSDKSCDIDIVAGSKQISAAVTYSHTATSTVSDIDPPFGSSAGGYSVVLTGSNFGSSVSVTIDGIECPIDSQSAT